MSRAFVLAAFLTVAVTACDADKTRYFHQVEGEAQFRGAIQGSGALAPAYADAGAATFRAGDHCPFMSMPLA